MKRILTGLLLMAGLSLNAQTITNPNFESWAPAAGYSADTLPLNWWAYYCNTVHLTTDSYQGSYASKVQGWFACGIAPGIMVNGQAPLMYGDVIQSGTPFTTKPASISGYYKYTDVTAGDSAEVTIILKRWNSSLSKRDTIGLGTKTLAAASAYSLYTVNINYLVPGVNPDSIIIMFNSSKYTMWDPVTMALPVLYADRIMMPETPQGIEEGAPQELFTSMVFPNPFSTDGTLQIDGEINGYCSPTLHIFDLSGKEVSKQTICGNRVKLQDGLAKGSYLYQVEGIREGLLASGKFIVR